MVSDWPGNARFHGNGGSPLADSEPVAVSSSAEPSHALSDNRPDPGPLGIETVAQESIPAVAPYEAVAEVVSGYIDRQLADKDIPAIVVALVDDQRIVWARGFGQSDPHGGRAATAETVVRVGSVSKLYTDVALMQLVEQGLVDLDAPVSRYLPEFRPRNPFETPITLRK